MDDRSRRNPRRKGRSSLSGRKACIKGFFCNTQSLLRRGPPPFRDDFSFPYQLTNKKASSFPELGKEDVCAPIQNYFELNIFFLIRMIATMIVARPLTATGNQKTGRGSPSTFIP